VYPRTYFETFIRYEAKDQVFVAMPFRGSFRTAYERVIEPAIKQVSIRGRPLVPRIINRGTSGSPDIHEQIFDAIIHSRLVIADMTVQFNCVGDDGSARWQENANVAYEPSLGLAKS
jgi:hypothetical protein